MIILIFICLFVFLLGSWEWFQKFEFLFRQGSHEKTQFPELFWCFNPLGQFFNTVYARGFLIQTLFTHARITQAGTICFHLCRQDVQSLGSFLSFVLTRRRLIKYLYVLWCAIGYVTMVHSIKLREDKRVTALVKTMPIEQYKYHSVSNTCDMELDHHFPQKFYKHCLGDLSSFVSCSHVEACSGLHLQIILTLFMF